MFEGVFRNIENKELRFLDKVFCVGVVLNFLGKFLYWVGRLG